MKSGNAKIYAPYNALRGLYETLGKREAYHEEKRELTDDQIEYLNHVYSLLVPGMHFDITYYDGDMYENAYGKLISFKKNCDGLIFFSEDTDKEMDIDFSEVYDIKIG